MNYKILYLLIIISCFFLLTFSTDALNVSSVACKNLQALNQQQLWSIVKFNDFNRYFILVVGSLSIFGLIITLLTWIIFRSFSPPSDIMFVIVIAQIIQNSSLVAAAAYFSAHLHTTVAPQSFENTCIAIGVFNIIGYIMVLYYNILFCVILSYSIRNTLKGALVNQKVYHIGSLVVTGLIIGATFLNQNIGLGLNGVCGFRAANRQSIARIIFELFVCGLSIFCMIKFKKKIPKNSYFQKQAIFGYYYYYIGFFAFSQLLVSISFLIGNISCRQNVSFTSSIIEISFTIGNCLTLLLSYILIILRFTHPILRAKIRKLLFDREKYLADDDSVFNQAQIQMRTIQRKNSQDRSSVMQPSRSSSSRQFRQLTKKLSSILPTINDQDNSWLGCLLQSIKGSQILSFLVGIMICYVNVEKSLNGKVDQLINQEQQQKQRILNFGFSLQQKSMLKDPSKKKIEQQQNIRKFYQLKKWKGLNAFHFNRFYQLSMNENITDQFINFIASDQYNLLVKKKLDGLRTLNYQVTNYFPQAFYFLLKKEKRLNVMASFDIQSNISRVKKQSYTNGGKSGQFFFATFDHIFFFKTIQSYECQAYSQRAKQFYEYFSQNPQSLIVKILGLYKFTREDIKQRPVYLIMMKNLSMSSRQRNYRVYDIKGSEFNRCTMDQKKIKWGQQQKLRQYTLKDEDFLRIERKIQIQPQVAIQLKKQLKKDIQFLGSLGVMDYSFLIMRRKGQKNPYTGLQQLPSTLNSDEVYNFGIIDYLESWNLKRKAQRILKTLATDKQVTAQDPIKYSQRLISFIDKII